MALTVKYPTDSPTASHVVLAFLLMAVNIPEIRADTACRVWARMSMLGQLNPDYQQSMNNAQITAEFIRSCIGMSINGNFIPDSEWLAITVEPMLRKRASEFNKRPHDIEEVEWRNDEDDFLKENTVANRPAVSHKIGVESDVPQTLLNQRVLVVDTGLIHPTTFLYARNKEREVRLLSEREQRYVARKYGINPTDLSWDFGGEDDAEN